MKQITEDYVSYEIAKLLKEKGFNESVYSFYNQNSFLDIVSCKTRNSYTCDYAAPTHQMALKWLREVRKIFIEPFVAIDLNGEYHYCFRLLNSICKDILEPKDLVRIGFKDTHEEAVEAAIKYCLENLI